MNFDFGLEIGGHCGVYSYVVIILLAIKFHHSFPCEMLYIFLILHPVFVTCNMLSKVSYEHVKRDFNCVMDLVFILDELLNL